MSQSKWNPNRRQQPPKKLGPLGVDSETRPSPRSVSESTANDIRTSVRKWLAPSRDAIKVSVSIDDYRRIHDTLHRRLFLNGEISSVESMVDPYVIASECGAIVETIMQYNREDYGYPVDERKPIMLYINSPGGEVTEGFPLIAAIETSKTPVYTVNIGKWDSMAFYIGIAGHKRFALPYTQFLLHEGYNGCVDSTGKVFDKIDFDRDFENKVVRAHVLKHSKMSPDEYDTKQHKERYMLPEQALEYGFIDEIVTNLDTIL